MILLGINLSELAFNLVVSFITSFLASFLLIFFLLKCFSPKIKISDFICKKNDEYKFKIVNLSIFSGFDVRLELNKFKNEHSNLGRLNRRYSIVNLSSNYWLDIPKFKRNKNYADNCCLVKTIDNLSEFCKNSDHQLELIISLKHGLTGISKTFKKVYCLDDIKENTQFTFGQKIEILNNNNNIKQ